uniref:NAD(P)/FAD-dependent oxidoreductase n=1 Tax=Candidatus Tripitaka californicus TaxID=3367616 RepID=UPI004024CC4D
MQTKPMRLGPLEDGQRVIIIGGGPAGSSCAIALKNLGRKLGRDIDVVLYEGMQYGPDSIKRVGVLAPPLVQTLENTLGVNFPCQLVARKIVGYYLHSGRYSIRLYMGANLSYVAHNVALDAYRLGMAIRMGVRVLPGRVKDIKISPHEVSVEGESGGTRGDVLVGAFGLDSFTAGLLEKVTPYRRPRVLHSIMTKITAPTEYLLGCEDYIHVFLPSMGEVEFGVVTPKLTHFIVNIAGRRVSHEALRRFLALPEVAKLIPADALAAWFTSGGPVSPPIPFPLEPARNSYGDRYVAVGDAAGLVRAYKGNGINSACVTGAKAAEVMLTAGISHEAFLYHYLHAFSDIIKDLPYGRAVRRLVLFGEGYGLLPLVIHAAGKDRTLVNVLIDFLSGHKTYHRILKDWGGVELIYRFLKGLLPWMPPARVEATKPAAEATMGRLAPR